MDIEQNQLTGFRNFGNILIDETWKKKGRQGLITYVWGLDWKNKKAKSEQLIKSDSSC